MTWRRNTPAGRRLMVNGVHLTALWTLGVAQPLFETLRSGETFAGAGWSGGEIVAFALGFALLPPAVLLGLEAAAGRASERAGRACHLTFVAGLLGVLAAYLLKNRTGLEPGTYLKLSLLAGVGGAAVYARVEAVRSLLTFAAVALPAALALFLLASPVRHLVFADPARAGAPGPAGTPVVMVVFDEFPVASLMGPDGAIAPRSYPNFARLARQSTWFRNATTVADHTTRAVPAILTGRYPAADRPPALAAYPRNLFTLLARSGPFDVHESVTRLCPQRLCPRRRAGWFGRTGLAQALVRVSLSEFLPPDLVDRVPAADPMGVPAPAGEFQSFLDALPGVPAGGLSFVHVLLPHEPWHYLPSGREHLSQACCREGVIRGWKPLADTDVVKFDLSAAHDALVRDRHRTELLQQEHLSQVRFTDRLLGRLLGRLKASGVYDRALVVVVADHGVSFAPGSHTRALSDDNLGGVLGVPLFVKRPHQRTGRVDDRPALTIDVLPTVADALDVRIPWPVDGRSLLGPRAARSRLRVTEVRHERTLHPELSAYLRQRRRVVADQEHAFHQTRSAADLFRWGPRPQLLGRRISELKDTANVAVTLDDPAAHDLRPGARILPVHVSGRISGPGLSPRDEVAIGMHGRIVATAWLHRLGRDLRFSVLLPESALHPGANVPTVRAIPVSTG